MHGFGVEIWLLVLGGRRSEGSIDRVARSRSDNAVRFCLEGGVEGVQASGI